MNLSSCGRVVGDQLNRYCSITSQNYSTESGGCKVNLLIADCLSRENYSLDTRCLLDNSSGASIRMWDSAAAESRPVTFGEGDGFAASRLRRRNLNNRSLK
jgi:hypothetical protein